jgi:phage FluMu protein Com
MNTIRCNSCGQEKTASEFSADNKKTCLVCKVRKHEQYVSEDHKRFLRTLYTKAKSAVKNGKRAEHVKWHISADDLIKLWAEQEGRCAVSGVILTHHKDGSGYKDFNASIDRINNERGYTPDNIRLVCYRANIMRHSLSGDMFYWWIRTINDFSCN